MDPVQEALDAARPKDPEGKPSLDELLSSIESSASGDKKGSAPGSQAQPEKQSDSTLGADLILAVEAITVAICRARSVQLRVRWTPQVAKLVRLTPDEKAALRPFAGAAAKYVIELLKKVELIAAGAFAIVYWGFLTERFAALKEQPRIPKPREGDREERASKANPQERSARKKRPGDSAKLVPVTVKEPKGE